MKPNSKRSPGRPRKSGGNDTQTAQYILRTASASFMQYGYEKVSVDQIAKACEVTKATVYYHYENKASLFTYSVVQMFANVCAHVDKFLSMPIPLKERLTAMAKVQMRNSFSEFETLMKEASSHLTTEQISAIREAEQSIHHLMSAAFETAINAGQLRKISPMLLSIAFSSLLMMGNRELAMNLFEQDSDQAAEAIVELFWHGALSENPT
ncbi:TetR/AcrR family transcriptional regulator [Paenibacillaceae bacterium]|nr:TetR/AcrR family transcriptional regulator [Paenibacillaceae bacterium]